MKNDKVLILGLLVALSGCALPPVQIRSAPSPSKDALARQIEIQSRDVAIDADKVFPQVLTVLLNAGYVVRSANRDLGQISFYQQWNDASQGNANIVQEGTAIFSKAGPKKTRMRVVLTGGWQRLEATGGGPKSTDYGMVGGVTIGVPAEEYKRVLDLLESGLQSAE